MVFQFLKSVNNQNNEIYMEKSTMFVLFRTLHRKLFFQHLFHKQAVYGKYVVTMLVEPQTKFVHLHCVVVAAEILETKPERI